jgi:hypothetical protein
VTERDTPRAADEDRREQRRARKRYETPRLTDYGRISKLTQSGGITSKDQGSMERQGT